MRRIPFLLLGIAALVAAVGGARAEDKVLNVYNWSDYIAPDTLERFTVETGIKVNYDVYDGNEILEAKLMAGRSGYDVVFPTAMPFLARQVKAGLYRKLDKGRLANLRNLDPDVMARLAVGDPGNAHAIPYMSAATGLGINVKKVKALAPEAPLDSWALVLDPKWTGLLASCGITLLDDPGEAFMAVHAYTGRDVATQNPADIDAAMPVLMAVRPHLRYIHSSKYINDLANGDICIAHGYGGDLVQARDRAREAGNEVDILISYPREGAHVAMDVAAIPADAPHPGNAHLFLDFIMRPEVVGAITEAVGFANAIPAADAFVSEARRRDPAVYPPAPVRKKFFVGVATDPKYDKAQSRAWTKVKTGR